jgi:protoporphyrinogen oxidase
VALFLDRPQVTANASLYFPDPTIPFTRLYEPKNRSLSMSPPDRTSLVAEIPCQSGDRMWDRPDSELIDAVRRPLVRLRLVEEADIQDAVVVRLPSVYPVLEESSTRKRQTLLSSLDRFSNLSVTGRNGLFLYTHIHDQLKRGKAIIE